MQAIPASQISPIDYGGYEAVDDYRVLPNSRGNSPFELYRFPSQEDIHSDALTVSYPEPVQYGASSVAMPVVDRFNVPRAQGPIVMNHQMIASSSSAQTMESNNDSYELASNCYDAVCPKPEPRKVIRSVNDSNYRVDAEQNASPFNRLLANHHHHHQSIDDDTSQCQIAAPRNLAQSTNQGKTCMISENSASSTSKSLFGRFIVASGEASSSHLTESASQMWSNSMANTLDELSCTKSNGNMSESANEFPGTVAEALLQPASAKAFRHNITPRASWSDPPKRLNGGFRLNIEQPPSRQNVSKFSTPPRSAASGFCCLDESSGAETSTSGRLLTDDRIESIMNDVHEGGTFTDTHCHLDFMAKDLGIRFGTWLRFKKEQNEKRVWSPACRNIIQNFCFPSEILRDGSVAQRVFQELLTAAKYPDVYIALGVHPHWAYEWEQPEVREFIEQQIHSLGARFVAFGETGLDYGDNNHVDHDIQKRSFRSQLEFFRTTLLNSKVLLIHCRDAEDDCFEIMNEMVPTEAKIHRHCWLQDHASSERWLNKWPNLYLGLTPAVWNASAGHVLNVLLERIDLSRIIIETDSPYFMPKYYADRGYRRQGHPGFGIFVAAKIAEVRSMTVKQVLDLIATNVERLYGIR